jgi:hypothetical protein
MIGGRDTDIRFDRDSELERVAGGAVVRLAAAPGGPRLQTKGLMRFPD